MITQLQQKPQQFQCGLVSGPALARLCGIPRRTLYYRTAKGQLPSAAVVWSGNRALYNVAKLLELGWLQTAKRAS